MTEQLDEKCASTWWTPTLPVWRSRRPNISRFRQRYFTHVCAPRSQCSADSAQTNKVLGALGRQQLSTDISRVNSGVYTPCTVSKGMSTGMRFWNAQQTFLCCSVWSVRLLLLLQFFDEFSSSLSFQFSSSFLFRKQNLHSGT